jgi:hypothetical protein
MKNIFYIIFALLYACSTTSEKIYFTDSPNWIESRKIIWNDSTSFIINLYSFNFQIIKDPEQLNKAFYDTLNSIKYPYSYPTQSLFAVTTENERLSIFFGSDTLKWLELISRELRKGCYKIEFSHLNLNSGVYFMKYVYPDTTYFGKCYY